MIFSRSRLLWQAIQTIRHQNQVIERLQVDCAAAELAYMRVARDLLEQFLIALDQPEKNDEYRDRLTASLGFYRDEIAVREEHVR